MKKLTGLLILFALILFPATPAFAQVPIDQQFLDAAEDLEPGAQLEFLELIRNPGAFEGAFENLGIEHELADRIEEKLNQKHKTDHALERLDVVTDKVGAHLEKIANQHAKTALSYEQKDYSTRTVSDIQVAQEDKTYKQKITFFYFFNEDWLINYTWTRTKVDSNDPIYDYSKKSHVFGAYYSF